MTRITWSGDRVDNRFDRLKPRLKFIERQHDPLFGRDWLVWEVLRNGYLYIAGRLVPVTEGSTVTFPAESLGPQWK